jgi:Domain of unknown function (DUF6973)
MASIYDQYHHLTSREQQFVKAHPIDAMTIDEDTKKAFQETTRMFGFNGHNDKTDAFRHCFWSALLARDIGYAKALDFTTAHESSPTNPADEKAMDLHNNSVGLLIGKAGMSDVTVSTQCMAALNGGRLKILVK